MTEVPLISVIIPAYNYGSYIGEAIESILAQDYPQGRMEIIVIDDGSTDNTRDVVRKYADRVTYLSHEHKGVAAARNTGISHAKGQIITFLDADDIWLPSRIRKVAEAFALQPDAGIVFHNVDVIDGSRKLLYKDFSETFYPLRNRRGSLLSDIVRGNVFCGASSFSFRAALLKQIFPVPEDIRRGVDFYLTAIAAAHARAWYLPEALGLYRLHQENLTFLDDPAPAKASRIHKDLSHTYEKVSASLPNTPLAVPEDGKALWRMHARSRLLSSLLAGERLSAIKQLPFLFTSSESSGEFFANIGLLLVTLSIPIAFYAHWVKLRCFIKKALHRNRR